MIENGPDITLENGLNAANSVTLRTLRKRYVVDLPPELPPKHLEENARIRHAFGFVLALKEEVSTQG